MYVFKTVIRFIHCLLYKAWHHTIDDVIILLSSRWVYWLQWNIHSARFITMCALVFISQILLLSIRDWYFSVRGKEILSMHLKLCYLKIQEVFISNIHLVFDEPFDLLVFWYTIIIRDTCILHLKGKESCICFLILDSYIGQHQV